MTKPDDNALILRAASDYGLSPSEARQAVAKGQSLRDAVKYRHVVGRRGDLFELTDGSVASKAELEEECAAYLARIRAPKPPGKPRLEARRLERERAAAAPVRLTEPVSDTQRDILILLWHASGPGVPVAVAVIGVTSKMKGVADRTTRREIEKLRLRGFVDDVQGGRGVFLTPTGARVAEALARTSERFGR